MTLLEVSVSDLALIERVRLSLEPGLNVLTGETGAGKSLVIDALALVLGGRADHALVRTGADRTVVEALFDRLPEPLICVREVHASGRSIARIDLGTVTAARLAEVAGPLVEIHGQHEQQRLLEGARQRDLLDAYGGHAALRGAAAAAVGAWRDNRAALEMLVADPREVARQLELHEHDADEIEAAALRAGEADELRAALGRAANAEQVSRLVAELRERLAGDRDGARDLLARGSRTALELARLDGAFWPLVARLEGLAAEVEDAADQLRRLASGLEFDAAAIAEMEARIGRIYALERKYGADEAAVIAHGQRSREEAARLRGLEAERAERAAADERLEGAARDAAAALTAARTDAGARLADAASEALVELGMARARLEVAVSAAELTASGADDVTFLIAPNPGEPPMPLARIASGGELSRVSLALKRVLAAADETPTLVFDEIDAGIGSRSADPVGRSLWRLARDHQVLCVTHLPQIAAYADAHFQIAKHERDGRTVTEVRRLDDEARIRELAHMLAGAAPSEASLAAARELRAKAGELRAGASATTLGADRASAS